MSVPRVRFGPRESRGWLLGMTTAQLALGVVAVFTITRILDTSPAGLGAARLGRVSPPPV